MAVVDIAVDILVFVFVFLDLKVVALADRIRHTLPKHDLQTFPIHPIHRK